MDLTCLTNYPPIPLVPKTANDSNTFIHPTYNPSSGGFTQIISAALARSTFSTNDIHSLINNLLDRNTDSWTASEISKMKPIPSVIIYVSIALVLFLIFSIVFCVLSCRNTRKYQRQSKTTQICISLLVIVYLLGIGDMAYVAYRINKSKLSIDNTIEEMNREIYPREIAEHMEYFNKQLNRLDQYCVQPNSILVNASKSMVIKAFSDIVTEKYFVQNISQSINSTSEHMRELMDEVNKHPTLPIPAKETFQQIQHQYQLLIDYVQIPIKEVCNYANGTETDIDKKLLQALDVVHVQVKQISDTITQNALGKITPWEKKMLLDTKSEEEIRRYANLAGTIFLVLVIVLGGIPLIFFVIILISRLCSSNSDQSNENQFPMMNVRTVGDADSVDNYPVNHDRGGYRGRNRVAPANYYPQKKPSGVMLCLMRIAFAVMMILLIAMVLLTSVYYALDLAVQGTCRTAHDDQPFAINILTEELVQANVIFGNRSEMNMTLMNVIHDCGNQTHFSRKLLEGYWSTLDNDVKEMMNTLSGQIHDKFIQSIGDIDVTADRNLLKKFASQADVPKISVLAQGVETDLTTIEGYFAQINASNSTLPQSLVQSTIDEFKTYTKNVLESTIDSCPLPLSTILKTDTLVCHSLGNAIGGLWLSVFLCMVLISVGFCIFGICVYKRLNISSG